MDKKISYIIDLITKENEAIGAMINNTKIRRISNRKYIAQIDCDYWVDCEGGKDLNPQTHYYLISKDEILDTYDYKLIGNDYEDFFD